MDSLALSGQVREVLDISDWDALSEGVVDEFDCEGGCAPKRKSLPRVRLTDEEQRRHDRRLREAS